MHKAAAKGVLEMVYNLISGFCMALADSVPGVSGGTIAFVMGFYDTFITSLSNLFHGTKEERRNGLKFLAKLGLGWVVGMALAVSLLAGVFTSGIYLVSSLFLGFVLASIPLIVAEEKESIIGQYKNIPFAVLGAALVILLSSFNLSSSVHNLGFTPGTALYTVLAGMLAISAMVLPGISGSTLLMTFGLYVPVITGVKEILHLHFSSLWLIVCLAIGILAGVVLTMRGIKNLLDHHRSAAVYAILGMMVGSLYAIVLGPTTLKVPQHSMTVSDFNIWLFLVGCLAVLGLYGLKVFMKKQKETNKDAELDSEC